jgi:hypothetical protein
VAFAQHALPGFHEEVSGFQRQGGECAFVSQSGGSAGGGAEKIPAGDYSINTLQLRTEIGSSVTVYSNRSSDFDESRTAEPNSCGEQFCQVRTELGSSMTVYSNADR